MAKLKTILKKANGKRIILSGKPRKSVKKIKCQCPEIGEVSAEREYLYSAEEKSGMNHRPNRCKGTNDIALYKRGSKKLYLCSCCKLFADKRIINN